MTVFHGLLAILCLAVAISSWRRRSLELRSLLFGVAAATLFVSLGFLQDETNPFGPWQLVAACGGLLMFFGIPASHGATDQTASAFTPEKKSRVMPAVDSPSRFDEQAAGVIHDFNNLLTAIQGSFDLLDLTMDQGVDRDVRGAVDDGKKALMRARNLSLGYLRDIRQAQGVATVPEIDPLSKQPSIADEDECQNEGVLIDELMADVACVLKRIVDPSIQVEVELGTESARVDIPTEDWHRLFVNMGTNARDALPRGGTIRIRTHRNEDDRVSIEFCDDGEGMSDDVLGRIFEAHFSTKKARGCGLGLSRAEYLAAQAGGQVACESAPGLGTRFLITLPRLGAEPARPGPRPHRIFGTQKNTSRRTLATTP